MLCQEKMDAAALVLLQASYMTSRTGLEAEAITRLTDGVQPPPIRAILVQCLAGEVAPSVAISRMIAAEGASTARAAIDDVTRRAATLSRASHRLVQDRVDELTQVVVEKVPELADVRSETKANLPESPLGRVTRAAGSGDHGESRTSG